MCPDLDNLGDHARFCGSNDLAARLHTVVKWLLAPMVKAVAVDPRSGVSAVVVEQDGTVRNRLRPSDLAFKANDVDYAVDVYRTCYYGTTAQNTPLEELFAKEDQENVKRYRAACEDQEINFFTFGIDAMG